jgi:thiamine transport system permease protein
VIKTLRKIITVVLFLVPIVFISCFFLYPITAILWNGLQSQDHLNQVTEVLRAPRSQKAIWFTFWQATISTVITILVALPSAALISKMKKRSRKWVRAAITVPFVLPTIVVAGAFEAVFKQLGIDRGPLSLHHTSWAIILAHVFFNYAVVARTVPSELSSSSVDLERQHSKLRFTDTQ